ncbi:16146_t:CDS:2, partial [Entrophospora sp. SA101]
GAKKQAAQTVMHAPWATLQAIAAGGKAAPPMLRLEKLHHVFGIGL